MKEHLVAIDCETGGLIAGHHALLQLAAVATWDAEPFNVWIWPDGHWIDPEAVPICRYSVEGWSEKGALPLYKAMDAFTAWLEKAPVAPWKLVPLAHNAGFDRAFLEASYRFLGRRMPLGHRWRCSQASLSFCMDSGLVARGSTSLDALAGLCGLERPRDAAGELIHGALDDARLCLAGYTWLTGLPDAHRRAGEVAATTPSLN